MLFDYISTILFGVKVSTVTRLHLGAFVRIDQIRLEKILGHTFALYVKIVLGKWYSVKVLLMFGEYFLNREFVSLLLQTLTPICKLHSVVERSTVIADKRMQGKIDQGPRHYCVLITPIYCCGRETEFFKAYSTIPFSQRNHSDMGTSQDW